MTIQLEGGGRKPLDLREEGHIIDQTFFEIHFKLSGKEFKIAANDIISFNVLNLDDITDAELDLALDRVSYYRYTMLAAGAALEERLATEKREFSYWLDLQIQEARRIVLAERMRMKDKYNAPASFFGQVTKDEILAEVRRDPSCLKIYNQYEANIAKMKRNVRMLFGLRDILQDRGGHLQSIGKRRLEHVKRESFSV